MKLDDAYLEFMKSITDGLLHIGFFAPWDVYDLNKEDILVVHKDGEFHTINKNKLRSVLKKLKKEFQW